MTNVSLHQIPREVKVALLGELGYTTDGTYVLEADGQPYEDPYVRCRVRLDNMAILRGSAIIIDDNPVSVDSYLQAHPDSL